MVLVPIGAKVPLKRQDHVGKEVAIQVVASLVLIRLARLIPRAKRNARHAASPTLLRALGNRFLRNCYNASQLLS